LIDLTRLSADFVAATRDADLLMLHGMGRAIESNFHVRFGCDTLWSAVIKDEAVARRAGGKLFDCVFRFEAAAG
jgi:type II pantothenate kinase